MKVFASTALVIAASSIIVSQCRSADHDKETQKIPAGSVLADISKLADTSDFQKIKDKDPVFHLRCKDSKGTLLTPWSAALESDGKRVLFRALKNIKAGDLCTLDVSAKVTYGQPMTKIYAETPEAMKDHTILFLSNEKDLTKKEGDESSLALTVSLYKAFQNDRTGPALLIATAKVDGDANLKIASGSTVQPTLSCDSGLTEKLFEAFDRISAETRELSTRFSGLASGELKGCTLSILERHGDRKTTVIWESDKISDIKLVDGENKQEFKLKQKSTEKDTDAEVSVSEVIVKP